MRQSLLYGIFLLVLSLLWFSSGKTAQAVAPPSLKVPVPIAKLPDRVRLTEAQMKSRWVTTRIVLPLRLVRTISRTGTLNFDEERVSVLAARLGGREVKVLAFEGQHVFRDDALALVYSPDFVTAEAEYLNAFKVARTIGNEREADSYIRAAAKKLLLMGASKKDLDRLSRTQKIAPYLTIHAPREGIILNSQLREGLFMNPGDQLLTIADLSKLWVYMDIYEGDLPLVRTGQTILVKTVAYPGETFRGRIIYQGGMVDPQTRTFHVRGEIDNPERRLKPGMFASVLIRLTRPEKDIALPDSAFLKDEKGFHVFVETAPGVFDVRPVVPGPEEEGLMTVRDGLRPGESVVVSGALLLEGLREQTLDRELEEQDRIKGQGAS